jgi:hypothetical protein
MGSWPGTHARHFAERYFLTLAFRFYSGDPGTMPNPGDTQVFVASMNVTYLFALGISFSPVADLNKEREDHFHKRLKEG